MVNYSPAIAGVVPTTVQFPLWHSSVSTVVKIFEHQQIASHRVNAEAIRQFARSLHREHLRPSFLNGTNSCAAETARLCV